MRISVKVKAHASKVSVKKLPDGSFAVSVTKIPEHGNANKAVIKTLADYFKVAQSLVRIISGRTSHIKIFEIQK
ncbi:MAG: DUF167 domain-containing protein [Patescibacteria group bacterium]